MRLADEADPREDPNWSGIHHLIWSVVTSGEQVDDASMAHDPPYAVRFFPDGADGSELGTLLERLVVEGRVTPRDTGEPVAEPLADVRHGGQYWGVLWVGECGDPELDRAREAIDQRWGPVWSDGEVGCDDGAAESLNVDRNARRVAVYFNSDAEARRRRDPRHRSFQDHPRRQRRVGDVACPGAKAPHLPPRR